MRKLSIIRRRDGFTPVELIVVLIIIGILLALVIPNLTGYIDKAQATSCRKNRVELEKIYRYDTLLAEAEGKTVTIATLPARMEQSSPAPPAERIHTTKPVDFKTKPAKSECKDFIMGEVRYASLKKLFPEVAAELFDRAEVEAKDKYEYYKKLNDMQ